ncbi:ribosomal protein RPL17 [Cardiosporidium cionae]|uniref:Ribosomal protein RPL17 n=1 Tax=Cardiosporidium cionae TaxID=476202 RepID=A0ABQ7J8W1_9APIC|nr:ribosomal protein RPL17 [Cardiosporidium cionae]|eukprot:KAF8820436.1 ribosomal protein RPL17 [Cardiosporidium cionae]
MGKYACEPVNPAKACKAKLSDARIHFKNTYETAQAIKHMPLKKAVKYLEEVIEMKRCIPFRKYTGSIGRTAQAKEFKLTQGRWPVKSCRTLLGLLRSAESNAEKKNLIMGNLKVEQIMVNRAQRRYRRTFRAHGRINPYMSSTCHVQLVISEKVEGVKQPDSDESKRVIKFTGKRLARKRLRIGGGI